MKIISRLPDIHLLDLIKKLWGKNQSVTGAMVQCIGADLSKPEFGPLGAEMIKEITGNRFYKEYSNRERIPQKLRQS
ncbi:MAG: hypothetical protein HAW66_05510 [Shewanella sp.]|nr:hypothetical protein [Shewanella sp.]